MKRKKNIEKEIWGLLKRPEVLIALLATFFRISISQKLSIWYPSHAFHDDQLFVRYANLFVHFKEPDLWSLVKTMSYPLFLNFVHMTGLSYSTVLAIVWIFAALLLVKVFKLITDNRIFLTFVYLYILFYPSAFDSWVGTRLYRNAIIAPFVLLTFSLMIFILLKLVKNHELAAKNIMFSSIILGILFSFTYYIKEDGIWLLPCLILVIFVSVCIVAYRCIKDKSKVNKRTFILILTLCLPILLFTLNTNIYKMINYRYFDVYEINTRTEGQLGVFVSNVYKIDSDNRTFDIWAPVDAIEKTFEVSETLKKYPELKEAIIHSPWFDGNIYINPIRGDFLTWVMRNALFDTGIWENEAQVDKLFKQINNELDEAFKSKVLEKDRKIQITASGGGRDIKEIFQLSNVVVREYMTVLLLKGYVPGGQLGEYTEPESYEFASFLVNENLTPYQYDNHKINEFEMENEVVAVVFKIYSILNPCLLMLTIFSIFYIGYQLLKKRDVYYKERFSVYLCCIAIIVVLFGISFIYALAIAWFSEFLLRGTANDWIVLKFYSVGLVAIFILIDLFGLFLFFEFLKKARVKQQCRRKK